MKVVEIIKDNTVEFTRFKDGRFYYKIEKFGKGFEFHVLAKDFAANELLAKEPAEKFRKEIFAYLSGLY